VTHLPAYALNELTEVGVHQEALPVRADDSVIFPRLVRIGRREDMVFNTAKWRDANRERIREADAARKRAAYLAMCEANGGKDPRRAKRTREQAIRRAAERLRRAEQ